MRLYDTYTRSLVELPAPPGPVRMYICGPTVYARAHIGNARPFVVGMWLRAWLKETGYDAELVHNITDINDKIYDAAPGKSAELAERATAWYLEDTGDLGLGMPDYLPKATESVPEIVSFIEELVATGHAYPAGGDVYFRVSSFPDYGRLSGQKPDQVEQGEEPSALKEDPRDFALWKANKPATEDTWWESPWGNGRPGWHIECSAMAEEIYGPAFEIHGGGLDLVFPHHENEVAQSRSLGHPFAQIWAHNGMLQFTGEKMSKSSGQVETIRDAIDNWGREAILVFFLTASWRKPIDYSEETMTQARVQADSFRSFFRSPPLVPRIGATYGWEHFVDALDDDFNTPQALAIMHSWRAHGFDEWLRRALRIFGLESLAGRHFEIQLSDTITVSDDVDVSPEISVMVDDPEPPPTLIDLVRRMEVARRAKEYDTGDQLRSQITMRGWNVENTQSGPRVTRAAPRLIQMGNPAPDDVRSLALQRFAAWQRFDDSAFDAFGVQLAEAGFESELAGPDAIALKRLG